ncbi:MAG: indole-3-glycerol phosphate synthase TrpC [Candidatus Amulumruptor sp.]|nr:indole-3-glycerol phosphate synthase TrpC [Candidatus Amulumruptor sp.]
MSNILDRIVANKRREIEAADSLLGREVNITTSYTPVSLRQSIVDSPTGIIAEFKRRSPSKGEIHPLAEVSEVVRAYQSGGAAACSVLTDTMFFGGALSDLMVARGSTSLPLLRKDFVVSRRQIAEARACGADAVLLIAAVLSGREVEELTRYENSLGIEMLLEFHNAAELDRYCPEVDVVGVNNRDLTTFHTDPMLAATVARELPTTAVKIAESGLTSIDEVRRLRDCGFSGFLIGETFMRHSNPGEALRLFVEGRL